MAGFSQANPFAIRDTHDNRAVWTYKILTIITWLLSVITTLYYSVGVPSNTHKGWHNSIWGHNHVFHTGFALNALITSLYWLALFLLQIAYVWHLFSNVNENVQAAASVGSHFIFNNLLHFAFVMLFVRGHFVWAELILIVNFFNLSFLYFRHSTYPRLIHIPAVSGPLAWTFVALYWNGAMAVNAPDASLPARIFANIAIWGILVYGMFFLVIYKDYTMGLNLSILTAALGVGQFFTRAIAFQWIFAFIIMGILFVFTLLIAIPGILGKDVNARKSQNVVSGDQERAPLLDDQ